MPRINPLDLLNCLGILLSPSGGIRSEADVARVSSLMERFSKKLVSKSVYLIILKETKPELLSMFMEFGGWHLIYAWLNHGIDNKNWPLIEQILDVLTICPIDIDRLKSNCLPKQIKFLSKTAVVPERIKESASVIVRSWLTVVKAATKIDIGDSQPESKTKSDDTRPQDFKTTGQSEKSHDSVLKTEMKESDMFVSMDAEPSSSKKLQETESNNKRASSGSLLLSGKRSQRNANLSLSRSHPETSKQKATSKPSEIVRPEKPNKRLRESRRDSAAKQEISSVEETGKSKSTKKEKSSKGNSQKISKKEEKKLNELPPPPAPDVTYSLGKRDSAKLKNEDGQLKKLADLKLNLKIQNDKSKGTSSNSSKEAKKLSMSVETRFSSNENKPKIVKTFNSKFRLTGLEEAIPPPKTSAHKQSSSITRSKAVKIDPPPSSEAQSKSNNALQKGMASKSIPIATKGKTSKSDIVTSTEIQDKVEEPECNENDKTSATNTEEDSDAEKSSSVKPVSKFLQESDVFMDAVVNAAHTQKESLQRKRKKSKSSADETKEGAQDTNEINVKPKLMFYKDIMESSDVKEAGGEKTFSKDATESKENEDIPEEESIVEQMEITESPSSTAPSSHRGILKDILRIRRVVKKKSVQWKCAEELEAVQYFESDISEHRNVAKNFWDMQMLERSNEREALLKARKGTVAEAPNTAGRGWGPLIEIDLEPVSVIPGYNSTEKEVQMVREQCVPEAVYPDKDLIPDSPAEPDMEIYAATNPPVIPMEDVTGSQDSINDFSHIPWPEPKPNPYEHVEPPNADFKAGYTQPPPTAFNKFMTPSFPPPTVCVPTFMQPGMPNPAMGNQWGINASTDSVQQPPPSNMPPSMPPNIQPTNMPVPSNMPPNIPPMQMCPPMGPDMNPYMMQAYGSMAGPYMPPQTDMYGVGNMMAPPPNVSVPNWTPPVESTPSVPSTPSTDWPVISSDTAKVNVIKPTDITGNKDSAQSDKPWTPRNDYHSSDRFGGNAPPHRGSGYRGGFNNRRDNYGKDYHGPNKDRGDYYSRKESWKGGYDSDKGGPQRKGFYGGPSTKLCRNVPKFGRCNTPNCRFFHPRSK